MPYETLTISFDRSFVGRAKKAVGLIKRAATQGFDRPLDEGLAAEREAFVEVLQTADAKEGLSAFLEQRKPDFKGR